jgi:TetR/AcrR family transcriptional regulator, acrEF/envCD operon repressor
MKAIRRTAQKEKTRRILIETSLNVFSSQGISATNTAELAKQAKVSHGTIFLHFPTREDLLFSVMNEFGNRLATKFDEVTKKSKGVAGVLKAHLKTISEYEGFYTHLIEDLPHLPANVKSRFFILQSSISYRINIEAQKEIKAGKIKNIERHILFNTWIALLHYYMTNKEIFSPSQSVISSKGNDLLKHFLNLIKK